MNCSKVQDKLFAFLDKELPLEEYQAVQAHLKQCSLCASEMLKVKKFKKALECAFETSEILSLKSGFTLNKILKRSRKRSILQTLVWVTVTVVTSLIILSVFSYFQKESFNSQFAQSLTAIHFGLSTERTEFTIPQSTKRTDHLIVREIKLTPGGY